MQVTIMENNQTAPTQGEIVGGNINQRPSTGDMPEVLTNTIYTPAFLREQIGKLMRVEFLIGTNNLVDRIGILADVGASYILLRSFENDSLVYCDLYAIKFITISTTSSLIQPQLNNMNNNFQGNMNRYW